MTTPPKPKPFWIIILLAFFAFFIVKILGHV